MSIHFKYFTSEDADTSGDLSLALEVVARENLLIDSSYLPIIQSAEQGNLSALCEMQTTFACGARGVPRHYALARTYTDRIKEQNAGDLEPEIEALHNSAKLEIMEGNIESAKQELLKAIVLTVNNFPPEEWEFEVFDRLREIIDAADLEKQSE